MYDILNEETPDKFTVIHQVKDDNKKRELRMEDEDEDYMDEGKRFCQLESTSGTVSLCTHFTVNFFFSNSQPHRIRLPLFSEACGVSATAGDHYLLEGDLPVHPKGQAPSQGHDLQGVLSALEWGPQQPWSL